MTEAFRKMPDSGAIILANHMIDKRFPQGHEVLLDGPTMLNDTPYEVPYRNTMILLTPVTNRYASVLGPLCTPLFRHIFGNAIKDVGNSMSSSDQINPSHRLPDHANCVSIACDLVRRLPWPEELVRKCIARSYGDARRELETENDLLRQGLSVLRNKVRNLPKANGSGLKSAGRKSPEPPAPLPPGRRLSRNPG